MNDGDRRLTYPEKVTVALRTWFWYAALGLVLRRRPLPDLVDRLGKPRRRARALPPRRLGRAVVRTLRLGGQRPRCLLTSLILFRLLRTQGEPAHLVIGLPAVPRSEDAHAWVEVDSADMGPPPGRGSHRELVRYG